MIEAMISKSCTFTKCIKRIKLRHQSLKVFRFDHAPLSICELGDDKITVAEGTQLKVLDIRGAKDIGVIFDGHQDRIRTCAKITKVCRLKKKIKGRWKTVK